ncbi:MAG TPA: MFS transporter [Sphingobium sp.]|nr:MFS transporter [Sphingobium sp.]
MAQSGTGPKGIETLPQRKRALRFILIIGILSFFADFTYEGARGVIGPYLALLGASATIVGIVTGFGELVGYGLRLVSGRLADATQRFWPITIAGYVLQMSVVPLLAFTASWPAAATLIILERVGKAIRNPPRDVMLSYAARQAGGYGRAFGIHEAMDQCGAMVGPLVMAVILAHQGSYPLAFGALAVPWSCSQCRFSSGLPGTSSERPPHKPVPPRADSRNLPGDHLSSMAWSIAMAAVRYRLMAACCPRR